MSKIIGVTVGTPISAGKIKEKMGITAGDVKFTDGDTFQQKYDSGELRGQPGKDGSDGADGYTPVKGVDYFDGEPGKNGQDGDDGVGIQSVVQTTTSNADGGTNIITVTKTDGSTSTFSVKNGRKGSDGADGKDGYTPVKGVDYFDGQPGKDGATGPAGADGKTPVKGEDYFTAADKQEMVDEVLAQMPEDGDIFYATYGTTTYDEIEAAYNSGKAVLLIDGNNTGPVSEILPSTKTARFVGSVNSAGHVVRQVIDETWSRVSVSFTIPASRVTQGAFAAQVAANSSGQTPGNSVLRNSAIVPETEAIPPEYNGEIIWMYK